jgi:hypothetical protein
MPVAMTAASTGTTRSDHKYDPAMSQSSLQRWNVAAIVLYVLLIPVAYFEFMLVGLAFGMSTDGCHDAACDASYHEEAAILTVLIGIVVVMLATVAGMVHCAARNRNVFYVPFVGLLGLFIVFMIGLAVLH